MAEPLVPLAVAAVSTAGVIAAAAIQHQRAVRADPHPSPLEDDVATDNAVAIVLQKAMDQLSGSIERLDDALQEERGRARRLEKEIDQLRQEIAERDRRTSELERRLDDRDRRIAELEQRLNRELDRRSTAAGWGWQGHPNQQGQQASGPTPGGDQA